MHPTTCLVVWFLMLVLIQNLQGSLLVAGLLALPLCGRAALRRCGQLTWRARWLFLSMLVILAWGGAGDPAWDGTMAPSVEGLSDALTQIGRLLLVLMAATILHERIPVADLLSGAHRLLAPLRRWGLDADRGVVRLLLVLRYLETMPRARDWRRLLLALPEPSTSEVFELADCPLRGRDYWTLALAVVGIVPLIYLLQA